MPTLNANVQRAANDIYLVWIHVKKCLSAAEVIIGGAWHLLNMPDGTSLTSPF